MPQRSKLRRTSNRCVRHSNAKSRICWNCGAAGSEVHMWQNFVRELARTIDEILRGFARFLPRFLEMLVIGFVGWLIAYIVKVVLRSVLKITRFDKLSEHTGATQWLRSAALPSL